MPAHVHAALMAEYAKDATETDKPWERWEFSFYSPERSWEDLIKHPEWDPRKLYRRKRIPLCQVEGKDVFPGDKLWHKCEGWVTVTKQGCSSDHVCANETLHLFINRLSWTEPPRAKTVYQWVFKNTTGWVSSTRFAATEEEWRVLSGLRNCEVRRLDYTAMEVPA